MKPAHLRCEYLKSPLGIDSVRPRLSWILESSERNQKQTAYQILVASDSKMHAANRGNLWDSGKVASDETLNIEYAGTPLKSGQTCYWKVRSWDKGGKAGPFSAPSFWEMGLLRKDDWHGKWIAATSETAYHPAPMFRRVVNVSRPIRQARIYICGLGYHELSINGKRIGDHQLDPGYTRYDRRHLYVTRDITNDLKQGDNAIGIMLGTGWFNVHQKAVWYFDKAPWRGSPRAIAELRIEYADGREEIVTTDSQWQTSTGPITFDSIYGGETYDSRLEQEGWDRSQFNGSRWTPAVVVDSPPGIMAAQQMPPIRIKERIPAAKITEPKPGVYLVDLQKNIAGFLEISARGKPGTKIVMKYGEKLNKDGTLDQSNLDMHQIKTTPPQPFQTDTYILKGGGEEKWHARFVYHGFQYVQISGYPGRLDPKKVTGLFIHSDVEQAGTFTCSNPMFNTLLEFTKRSYLSNMQSIFTDCPHREKNGWTGDAHLATEQGLFNYRSEAVYTKWLNDLKDEMRDTGELPGIVPSSGWGYEWGNGPAWDSAYVLIPWYLYQYRADTRILAEHYDHMKRYVDYLTSRAKDGIVSIGLGDWAPWKAQTPVEVTSTGYYYRDALIVADAAAILGKTEDSRKYRALAVRIQDAFNRKFFNLKDSYANGTQTALSCALYHGLCPESAREAVLANLVRAVDRSDGHIDTGILGAKYLLNCLTDMGRADVAYRIASQRTQPGWGSWIDQGATSLWESWQGTDSRNHIMYGDICAWFYKALAGINPDPAGPGFKRFIIRPNVVGDLTFASATYDSPRGRISSSWKLENGVLTLEVTVPPNATATIYVPGTIRGVTPTGGNPKLIRKASGYSVFEVGSGTWTLHLTDPRNEELSSMGRTGADTLESLLLGTVHQKCRGEPCNSASSAAEDLFARHECAGD